MLFRSRIGILTGGGDCPGLNAVIRAVVRKGEATHGHEFVGFLHGWRGVVEGETVPLSIESTRGILARGGTILLSSRTNPYRTEDGAARVHATLERLGVDALVAIGGEDTLGVARRLHEEGVAVVGVPKTIDNDLSATDVTFGFDTAVQTAVDAIDRLHTTAESHDRVMVVEVMGRHAGWIAVTSGIAGGAEIVLAPEEPFDIERIEKFLVHRHRAHASFSIVVVAEGDTLSSIARRYGVSITSLMGEKAPSNAARAAAMPESSQRLPTISFSAPIARTGVAATPPYAKRASVTTPAPSTTIE